MSNNPFGFVPTGGEGDEPSDPFAALFGGGGAPDLGAAFSRLGEMLSQPSSGPVNWTLAHDAARAAVAQAGDSSVSAAQRRAVEEAVRLAELWLDPVTALPAGTTGALAWSRAEWVEGTLAAWQTLIDPLAAQVVASGATALPAEMREMAGPLMGMVSQLGGAMFGAQVGRGLAELAGEVVGSADVGLPLGPAGRAVLLPANIEAFGQGLGLPADDVRLYLALRECAHQRLFAHVPWLAAVEDYARGVQVDTGRLQELMGSADMANPAALQEAAQEAMESGLFAPQDTPAQKAALARLETLLALVEGWVDAVVTDAAVSLPSAVALRETVRRTRATGGPAEQTFATLVGLELRPRRLRDAAALWAALTTARGRDGRDAVWGHPDLLPTAEDLDDPSGFVDRGVLDLSALDTAGEAPREDDDPHEGPVGDAGSPTDG